MTFESPLKYHKMLISFHLLTHACLASYKKDIDKQCRPRSDAEELGVALERGV